MTTEAITTQAFAATPGLEAGREDMGTAARSRSFIAQAMLDTFGRIGTRIGALWIAILVLGAVFAPFIANSQPVLVREAGRWSSPLARNLGSSDVMLLGAFFTLLGLTFARVRFITIVQWTLWMIALLAPVVNWRAVQEGWRPAEDLSPHLGMALLVSFCLLDFGVLIAIPVLSGASSKLKIIICSFGVLLVSLLILFPVDPPQNVVWDQWRTLENQGKIQAMWHTPVPFSPNDYLRDQPEARLQPPSIHHWMGTEASGADVFSRMLHASRIALSIGFIATGISVTIGIIIGGLMGYYAGTIDIIGMRLIEIFEALPALVLLITFCAFFGRNLYLMMAIIGFLSWTGDARFIRGEFFRLRKQDFVQAAVAGGLPRRSVIFRHMLPNGITPVLISSSFGVANAILLESTLSFLGLGLVDEPSWGQLLNQARAGGTGFVWWMAVYPGLAIFLTVFAYNLIGEAVRDALDPKLRKRD